MRNTKIIIAVSALMLGIGSFIITNAHSAKHTIKRHFGQPTTAYYLRAGAAWQTFFYDVCYSDYIFLTTTISAGKTARIITANGAHTLYTVRFPNTTHQLYYP